MALSLEDFLLRARVLKLYRHALRISRRAPSHAREDVAMKEVKQHISFSLDFRFLFFEHADLRQIIRQEMENNINRSCNEKQRIRYLISEGLERVKRLDETLDMQGY
ncbi:hypothetical protein RND71_021623 [Anisodus tanguticus]|uniref:Uncharacterized protein n=1 Tax=Anisodus tanguticus TaxID=243964 RepID=A0AAE1VFE5_9SOLA|nr:hypothetical protein RND71_021623 [Anisodus tanguticus]